MQENEQEQLTTIKKEINDIISNLNATTLCFTGHRSQKLPWRLNENDDRCIFVKEQLYREIEKSINAGYKTFICGMAIGFDMMCAEAVLDFKKQYKDIKLIGAIPCEDQDIRWNNTQKNRYRNLLKQLDGIRCICKKYNGKECMLERNRYMVNNSSKIIALFNGLPGGTQKTLDYAKEQGLDIVIIKP